MMRLLNMRFFILAIVVSLVAVPGVWADELSGTVTDWSTASSYYIVIDVGDASDTYVYGVNVEKLNNRKSLTIEEGTSVIIEYVIVTGKGGTDNYFACSITVAGKYYDLSHDDDVCSLLE